MTSVVDDEYVGSRVLFFGRFKCSATRKIYTQLLRYDFDVTYIESKKRGEALPEHVLQWEGDYIFCFRSLYILPDKLLKKSKIAAINFHPAPPEYPGSGCINFALYEGEKIYGVTAHLMNEKVDNGQILEVRRFPVGSLDNLSMVLDRTLSELYFMASDFIHFLVVKGRGIILEKATFASHESWSGDARLMREFEALSTVDCSVSKSELENIIRATYVKDYPPKITLHGYNFYLKIED
ncbi:formyltransferase family protein [Litorivicinus sp.]|nr:formyltransferase family protein [Litorivicinus sp.]